MGDTNGYVDVVEEITRMRHAQSETVGILKELQVQHSMHVADLEREIEELKRSVRAPAASASPRSSVEDEIAGLKKALKKNKKKNKKLRKELSRGPAPMSPFNLGGGNALFSREHAASMDQIMAVQHLLGGQMPVSKEHVRVLSETAGKTVGTVLQARVVEQMTRSLPPELRRAVLSSTLGVQIERPGGIAEKASQFVGSLLGGLASGFAGAAGKAMFPKLIGL